ncbi:MAG: (2Fe-2S)-binding protein [Haliea sp.]|nr:(2Fe-2S)-binding protein [Haliea sp.]|tara:strand:+ start:73941 stop:74402 length:462 start_codon:yes stop_codon:yes gene_type:complete
MKLNVNGEERQLDAPAEMPLLWALRDLLGLRGTRYACGQGLCGSCTVHLDGKPVRSCLTTLEQATGAEVTTIEGLGGEAGDHPLQQAWREHGVPQCGYCQAGQLMSAAALLRDTPSPSDEEIDSALAGNLCRCGTYARIRAAVHAAAEQGGDA